MIRRKKPQSKAAQKHKWVRALGVMGLLSLMASIISIAVLEKTRVAVNKDHLSRVSSIAFGSGTSLDYRSQPIWVQGIIPSNPNAWIWLGDMAYMDKPRINCDDLPWHTQCNCSSSWLHQQNHSCMAGNTKFASSRMEVQLSNPDYAQGYEYTFKVEDSVRAQLANILTYRMHEKIIKVFNVKSLPPPLAKILSNAYTLFFDGAFRRATGKAGEGLVLVSPEGEVVAREQVILEGSTSNNEAEYDVLINGLKMCLARRNPASYGKR
ncbi:hypothetical protein L7F22_063631 [Adiantum nelumboides]|nr:hypothetical protein [Adiantum nelumboides]